MPQSLKELLWGWELDQSIPKQIGLIKLIKFLPKRKNNTHLKFVCSKAYTDQILHLVIYFKISLKHSLWGTFISLSSNITYLLLVLNNKITSKFLLCILCETLSFWKKF